MRFKFHSEAEKEFNDAVNYYQSIGRKVGHDFALEVHETIQRIIAFPKAWPMVKNSVRRSLVRRFPYGILYSIENEELFILAVMNLHRHPDYWTHRI